MCEHHPNFRPLLQRAQDLQDTDRIVVVIVRESSSVGNEVVQATASHFLSGGDGLLGRETSEFDGGKADARVIYLP